MVEDNQLASLLHGSSGGFSTTTSTTVNRTGTLWTAVAHIITGVVGSGVLSLAWSIAQLGWIAGPISVLLFAGVTLLTTFLLCDCYMSPDPELGPNRHRSYLEAVNLQLGPKNACVCGLFVYSNLYGCGVAYTITSAISMRAIQQSNCYHKQGHKASCSYNDTHYMLLFGLIQMIISQIPNLHHMDWLSIISATMSFTYSFIGLGLGLAKLIVNGAVKGSISGVPATSDTTIDKIWLIAQSLGDIAFAYPYTLILFEIQDTLKSPPPQNRTMKKASSLAIFITTGFYLLCGGFGYAAFGDDTPGNLLTGFGFYEPYWLVDFANACVLLHLVGGYQIYTQPLFGQVDRWLTDNKYPFTAIVNVEYHLPGIKFKVNVFRLLFRTVYVASTTGIAMLFPYFNQVLALIGALNFWPLAIYFPIQLYVVQRQVHKWSNHWFLLQLFNFVCLPLALFAITGSVHGLINC